MLQEICKKLKNCVFSSVSEWAKSLSVTSRYHIRKIAWIVLLCFYCKALFAVWLACIYLSQNTFEVSINGV